MSLIDEIKNQEKNQITKEWVSERIDLIIETAAQTIYSNLRKQILDDVRRKGEDGKKGVWYPTQRSTGFDDHHPFTPLRPSYASHQWIRSKSVIEQKDNRVYAFSISCVVQADVQYMNYKNLVKESVNANRRSYGFHFFSLNDFQDVKLLVSNNIPPTTLGVEVEFNFSDCFEEKKGIFKTKKIWSGFAVNQHFKKLVRRISEIAKADGVEIDGPKIIESFEPYRKEHIQRARSENECFDWNHTHPGYYDSDDYTYYEYTPGFKYRVIDD